MTVYVDNANITKDGIKWCHLMADSLEELHEFAQKIGLKREWCHNGDHYDVTSSLRKIAVKNGAREIDVVEMVEVRRRLRTTT